MNRFAYISLIFCFALIQSCERTIDPENYPFHSQMVLNALFHPDAPWEVRLMATANALDPDDTIRFIDGARVLLRDENGNALGTLQGLGGGIYHLPGIFPEHNHCYTIEAEHAEFPSLRATSCIPAPVSCDSIHMMLEQNDSDERLHFVCTLPDNLPVDTPLLLAHKWQKRYMDGTEDSLVIEGYAWIRPETEEPCWDLFLPDGVEKGWLFLKKLPTGKTIRFYSFDGFRRSDDPFLLSGSAQLFLVSPSPDFYRFMKSLVVLPGEAGLPVGSLVSPADIYSNVQGGKGIFAGFSQYISSYDF